MTDDEKVQALVADLMKDVELVRLTHAVDRIAPGLAAKLFKLLEVVYRRGLTDAREK